MQRYHLIFIPVFILVLLASCGQYPCAKGELRYHLIDFSDADADTIILRRFPKNSTILADSFVFNETNPIRFVRVSSDTLVMPFYITTGLLQSNYDYQLYFPGAARVISITSIQEEQTYGTRSGFINTSAGCTNIIKGCTVDGILVSAVVFPNAIYLRK